VEVLYLEPAVVLDDRVEDLLHDVRVDEVALGLHHLLPRPRWFLIHPFSG